MAYRFRLYAPTGEGVIALSVVAYETGYDWGTYLPQGTGTACCDFTDQTTGFTITPQLQSGVSVSRWVINQDGVIYYRTSTVLEFSYVATATNISVRLEVTGAPTTNYTLTLSFNANGGSGGPSSAGPFQVNNNSAVVTIPTAIPTRNGYAFLGWSANQAGTGNIYSPGATYTNWWAANSNSTQILYATWQKQEGSGKVHIGNNYGFDSYTPYVWYNDAWQRAVPYIWYNGGWKKGV